MDYNEFLQSKRFISQSTGFTPDSINPMLFDFQRDIDRWACKKGKAGIFAQCGLGKTPMQLAWGEQVCKYGDVLIAAPLAVSRQTIREGQKFNIPVNLCRTHGDVKPGINITNYEMLEHFDAGKFAGIILDESSILKSYDGKYRNTIISMFRDTPYKLSCTATPAPNDFMELGNQCEFLNVMSRTEMLATFFVHDGGDTSKWRLKGHAEDKFWEWVASWAVVIQRPSDLGYSDGKFILPPLNIQEIIVDSPHKSQHGQLSFVPELALTLQERREARRDSLENRVAAAAELTKNGEQWLLWCDLNAESDALAKAIPGAVEVKGSDSQEHKESAAIGFANGDIRVLVSKPSIFGFGLNWQSCHNMAFVGLSDSYEQIYQAMRRCWRFGQIYPVNVYIITSRREGAVKANIERKEADSERMIGEMVRYTKDILTKEIRGTVRETTDYNPTEEMILPEWLGVVA